MGTPVLITKTEGFWEPSLFNNNEEIVFIEKNEINLWKEKIYNLIEDKNTRKKISQNGKELISVNNNLETFNKKLKNIIDLS